MTSSLNPLFDNPGDYIGGQFTEPSSQDGSLETRSPGDLNDIVGRHGVTVSHVDHAVGAAKNALAEWSLRPESERAALLRRYQEKLREHEDLFAETIAREVGKPLWDARGEAKALAGKVDVMLGAGAKDVTDFDVEAANGGVKFRPLGVVASIGPFNFPAHLPNGQMVPALLKGNTVVFKPSEKTPNAPSLMMRCFHEAGFPPGVVNMIQGEAETAKRLVAHEDVNGVLFTGSVAVGKAILKANIERPGRMVALELGGKNASIVLDDADLERASRQLAFAAFASGGQRCTASSRIIVHDAVFDELAEMLVTRARALRVGHPLDDVFMGPVISESAREALTSAVARAREAGFEALEEGGPFELPDGRRGFYLRPSVHVAPTPDIRVDGYTHDELFGPDVALYRVSSLEQAIELANGTRYGLASAVFTKSRERFLYAAARLEAGLCHWNQSTAGASGLLPFGGVKDSGNHRPAGIRAAEFCTFPQAVRYEPKGDALPSWPGFE